MNTRFMSQRVVTDIGNYIESFIESDANNFVGVWRDYLRIKVSLKLDNPLKILMNLKKSESIWCWVNFMYEAIPTFCFICGMVGHGEKFCEKLFDTPIDQIEKPYGAWMRVGPRRRSHTLGSKWLRPGGIIPANNKVVSSGSGVMEVVAVENADNGYQGKKVGNDGKGNQLGVNQGNGEIKGIIDISNSKNKFKN